MIAALEGHFGDYHPPTIAVRIEGTQQKVNPLMTLYWIYDIDGVCNKLKYDVDKLKETENEEEIMLLLKGLG